MKAIGWTVARTLEIGATAVAIKTAVLVSTPLALKGLDAVGLGKFIPAWGRNLLGDVSMGLHAMGGLALGHISGEYLSKKIGG